MKKQAKVIELSRTATAEQMETALNNWMNKGWMLIQVFDLGNKTFAVLAKIASQQYSELSQNIKASFRGGLFCWYAEPELRSTKITNNKLMRQKGE